MKNTGNRVNGIKNKQFDVHEKNKQVCQINTMIDEFTKIAEELSNQIKNEEEKTGITDVEHFAYPTFAKAARDRRQNIINSINDLKQQKQNVQGDIKNKQQEIKTHTVRNIKKNEQQQSMAS